MIRRAWGWPLFTNPQLQVPRTWRERLFTRPWRPWVRLKADDRVYVCEDMRRIVCHPDTVARLAKLGVLDNGGPVPPHAGPRVPPPPGEWWL